MAVETQRAGGPSTNRSPMSGYLRGPSLHHIASEAGSATATKHMQHVGGVLRKSRLRHYAHAPLHLVEGTQTSDIVNSSLDNGQYGGPDSRVRNQAKVYAEKGKKQKRNANQGNTIQEIQSLEQVDTVIRETMTHLVNLQDRINPSMSVTTSPPSGLDHHTEEASRHLSKLDRTQDGLAREA
jgi:hypothetical protein